MGLSWALAQRRASRLITQQASKVASLGRTNHETCHSGNESRGRTVLPSGLLSKHRPRRRRFSAKSHGDPAGTRPSGTNFVTEHGRARDGYTDNRRDESRSDHQEDERRGKKEAGYRGKIGEGSALPSQQLLGIVVRVASVVVGLTPHQPQLRFGFFISATGLFSLKAACR